MIKTNQAYRQCSMSVMDTIADPHITFDDKGICNYYYEFLRGAAEHVKRGEAGVKALEKIVADIKEAGKGKDYDCIMGLSGGVDSSYVAYLCKQYGLRPLAVHFDNGWNSELAVQNIESMVTKCGFDLYTLVVDWDEFRDIHLSYIKASVVDIEVPTDHAITATLYKLALKHNIKYSLSGSNINSEFVMPKDWIFNKGDHTNLLDIHKQFGTKKIKTFPLYDTMLKKRVQMAKVQSINMLNYVDYNKIEAKKIIGSELGWRDYGGKHYESLFTKFYQAYILPEKFGIDKRKPHLSSLIFSNQITKQDAMRELEQPLYEAAVFSREKDFFLKKLGLSDTEWQTIMDTPRRSHLDFATERPLDERYKVLKPAKFLYKKIMGN